jgi:hypothetical protein
MGTQASAEQRLREPDIVLPPAAHALRRLCRGGEDRQPALSERQVIGHEPQYVGRVGGALVAEDGHKAAETA